MKSLPDRLNEQLENQNRLRHGKNQLWQGSIPAHDSIPEVDELAKLAQYLQMAPQLQVEPGFTARLETRMLAHSVAQSRQSRMQTTQSRTYSPFLLLLRPQFVFVITSLVLLLIGTTSVLTAAAQVTDSGNPLYSVKRWEQGVQRTLTVSATDRTGLDEQIAQEQLNTLAKSGDPTHASTYQQALANLNQQINTFAQSVATLPAGAERDSFQAKLVTLKANARQTLRGLLPQLSLAEKQSTTTELGRLGDTIPHIDSATVTGLMSFGTQTIVQLTGNNIQTGARLLINDQLTESTLFLQHNTYVSVLNGSSQQRPDTIGILNPDGTIAQTTAITFALSQTGQGSNHSSWNQNGQQPVKTPVLGSGTGWPGTPVPGLYDPGPSYGQK